VRSYLTITKDLGRVMTRVKAIYRSWAIPCTGLRDYTGICPRNRPELVINTAFLNRQMQALDD